MKILLDTNVVLRIAQAASPQHHAAREAVLRLHQTEVEPCLVPQVVYDSGWSPCGRRRPMGWA